jgi:SAM-dependent methyltransferase
MADDARAWDDRYRRPGYWAGTEPAEFLVQTMPLLPRGTALDIASGEGRNAVFLAARGFHVFAVDRSRVALQKTEAAAQEQGIPSYWTSQFAATSREPGVALVEADLESLALPAERFAVVLCVRYLQRSLFPSLVRALRPRGVLLYETYTQAQLKFPGSGPHNPEFLLRPGELRTAFCALELLFYSEICAGKGVASLLARRQDEGSLRR